MSRKYAVYCTADDNYIFPSIVALESIRRFHPECDLFVIGNQRIISEKKLEILNRFDIHFLHSDKNKFFADSRWPDTCYLMLFGPEILWEKRYEYSLGLDADILCVHPLDLDEVFSMTIGYAGIENQGPRRENFEDPDFIRQRYKLSEEALNTHNTNTGVVFWNNKRCVESKLGERSVEYYQRCSAQTPNMFTGDQSLFALVSILEPALPWLILHRGYNYRVHNASDQKEDIKEEDIRIYHFIGPKPWESVPLKERLLNPSLLLHRDKYFAFLAEQGVFNRDLTIKNRGAVERISTSVRYSFDDWMTAIFIKPPVVSGISAFVAFVRKAKAGLLFANGDHRIARPKR